MFQIKEEILINAPIQIVFDAERNISLHRTTQSHRGERAVAGVTQGLIEKDQEVEWEARHFFIKQRLRVRITQMDKPTYFKDEMISGAFKLFVHEHFFIPQGSDKTLKKDVMTIQAPLGFMGLIAEAAFLSAYMRRFLRRKNWELKELIELKFFKGPTVP